MMYTHIHTLQWVNIGEREGGREGGREGERESEREGREGESSQARAPVRVSSAIIQ